MDTAPRKRLRVFTMVGIAAIASVAAVIALGGSAFSGEAPPPPTAYDIVRDGGPTGEELAAALGLELLSDFPTGECAAWVEMEDSGAGYCFEGIGDNRGEQTVIARALLGEVLTAEDIDVINEVQARQEAEEPSNG
jgi:hypothetical protein